MSNQTSGMRITQTLLALFFFAGANLRVLPQHARMPSPATRKWEILIPEIAKALQRSDLTCDAGHDYIQVVDAFDTAGLSVALVDYCQSGASTDSIVAMQLEAGKPVVSRFVRPNGATFDPEFLSGASVTHSDDTRLVPEKKAVLHTSTMKGADGRPGRCSVEAYLWNPHLRVFQTSARLSREAAHDSCSKELTR